MRHSLWGGLSLGTVTGLFVVAVRFTTIANVTIINGLQIVVVSVVSWLVFGERMSRRDILYAALAMAGVAVVALGSSGSENWSLGGDLAAVGGLFAWCFYFYATRRAQMKASTQEYTACVAIYVGLISLPLAALVGQDLSWPSGEDWMWLAALAFGLGILGHNAMNWSLQHVPLWLVSTLSLFTPVVASALAWLVFDEALSTLQMLAMALVVVTLAMIVRNQSRPRIGAVPAGIGPRALEEPHQQDVSARGGCSNDRQPEAPCCRVGRAGDPGVLVQWRQPVHGRAAIGHLAFVRAAACTGAGAACTGAACTGAARPGAISARAASSARAARAACTGAACAGASSARAACAGASSARAACAGAISARAARAARPGAACAGASSARAARAARARAAAARPGAGSIRVPERLVRGLFLLGSCQL